MLNPWFKFYGSEYLADPKIDQLTPFERSCWITLLCLANVSNKNGVVDNLKIFTLLTKSGIYPLDSAGIQLGLHDDYENNLGVLEHFESLDMVERVGVYSYRVKNWEKRQETNLTDAERAKSYRDRKKIRHENVTSPVTNVTLEENRIDNTTSDVETSQEDDVTIETDEDLKPYNPLKGKKRDTSYRKVFELWGKDYPLNWRVNRTEIEAAKNLIKEAEDINQIQNALKFYEKFKDDPYCPQVLKPSDLDRKWDALLAYKKKHG